MDEDDTLKFHRKFVQIAQAVAGAAEVFTVAQRTCGILNIIIECFARRVCENAILVCYICVRWNIHGLGRMVAGSRQIRVM